MLKNKESGLLHSAICSLLRIAYQLEIELGQVAHAEKRSQSACLIDPDFLFINPDKQSAQTLAEVSVAICLPENASALSKLGWLRSACAPTKSLYANNIRIGQTMTQLSQPNKLMTAENKEKAEQKLIQELEELAKADYVPAMRVFSKYLSQYPAENARGQKYLEKAALAGNAVAQFTLYERLKDLPDAKSTKQDKKKKKAKSNQVEANNWLQKAADNHHPDAQFILGLFMAMQTKTDFSFDPNKAFHYLQAAAENRVHPSACYYMALMIIAVTPKFNIGVQRPEIAELIRIEKIVALLKGYSFENLIRFLKNARSVNEKQVDEIFKLLSPNKAVDEKAALAAASTNGLKLALQRDEAEIKADEKYSAGVRAFLDGKLGAAKKEFKSLAAGSSPLKEPALMAYFAALLGDEKSVSDKRQALAEASDHLAKTALSVDTQKKLHRICYTLECELKQTDLAEERLKKKIKPVDSIFIFVKAKNAKNLAQMMAGAYEHYVYGSRYQLMFLEPLAEKEVYAKFVAAIIYNKLSKERSVAGTLVIESLAKSGHVPSLSYLGDLYCQTLNGFAQGVDYLATAGLQGYSDAAWQLVLIYTKGMALDGRTVVPANPVQMKYWLDKAVSLQNVNACNFYAEQLAIGAYDYHANPSKAFELIVTAATEGQHDRAAWHLGRMILTFIAEKTQTAFPFHHDVSTALLKDGKVKNLLRQYNIDDAINFLIRAKTVELEQAEEMLQFAMVLKNALIQAEAPSVADNKSQPEVQAAAPVENPNANAATPSKSKLKRDKQKKKHPKPAPVVSAPAKPKNKEGAATQSLRLTAGNEYAYVMPKGLPARRDAHEQYLEWKKQQDAKNAAKEAIRQAEAMKVSAEKASERVAEAEIAEKLRVAAQAKAAEAQVEAARLAEVARIAAEAKAAEAKAAEAKAAEAKAAEAKAAEAKAAEAIIVAKLAKYRSIHDSFLRWTNPLEIVIRADAELKNINAETDPRFGALRDLFEGQIRFQKKAYPNWFVSHRSQFAAQSVALAVQQQFFTPKPTQVVQAGGAAVQTLPVATFFQPPQAIAAPSCSPAANTNPAAGVTSAQLVEHDNGTFYNPKLTPAQVVQFVEAFGNDKNSSTRTPRA